MRRLTKGACWFVAASMLVIVGCTGNPLSDNEVPDQGLPAGHVYDDSVFLPGGTFPGAPLAGVRVEVIDGPAAGMFAITGPDGSYKLGNPVIVALVRATKDGYEPKILRLESCIGGCFVDPLRAPDFNLGQSPHTLWGDVYRVATSPLQGIEGVQVSILDGPNAGKVTVTDAAGRYRFDANVTSPSFNVRFTKAGYQMRTILVSATDCVNPQSFGACDVGRNLGAGTSMTPVG